MAKGHHNIFNRNVLKWREKMGRDQSGKLPQCRSSASCRLGKKLYRTVSQPIIKDMWAYCISLCWRSSLYCFMLTLNIISHGPNCQLAYHETFLRSVWCHECRRSINKTISKGRGHCWDVLERRPGMLYVFSIWNSCK